jgi:hypothetical protein
MEASAAALCYSPAVAEPTKVRTPEFYCPRCAMEVEQPLTCGDCGAVICPRCGTPLESADELGIG